MVLQAAYSLNDGSNPSVVLQYELDLISLNITFILFYSDMLEDDLVDCGVVNTDHRREISSCIGSLGWME